MENATPKTITMSESQFKGLMDRIDKLETGKGLKKPKRVTEHTALIRFYNNQPVIGLKNHHEEIEHGRRIGYIDLILLDGKTKKVNYLEFLNDKNQVLTKILSQKAEEITEVEGSMRSRNPDEANISGKNTFASTDIELEVTKVQYTSEVEVLEGEHQGKKFTLSNDSLNM